MKIKIITRSMNYRLYKMSQNTINLPSKRKRVLFSTADGYLYKSIINCKADIVINIDEDAFISSNVRLKQLLEYVLDNNYINCGMPDGGVVDIRKHNPLVTNPFFNIINVSELKKTFNLDLINTMYSEHKTQFEKYAPFHLLKTKYQFDYYEPYVPFFVWIATNHKTLWLDAKEHKDGFSTILLDHNNNEFLYHSWYSRLYGVDEFHTKRIENLYKQVTNNNIPIESFKDRIIIMRDKIGYKYWYNNKLILTAKLKK